MKSIFALILLLTLISMESHAVSCSIFVTEHHVQGLFDKSIRPLGIRAIDSTNPKVIEFFRNFSVSNPDHVRALAQSISSLPESGLVWLNFKRAAFELIDTGLLNKGFVSSLYARLFSDALGHFKSGSREHEFIMAIYDSYFRRSSQQDLDLPPDMSFETQRLFHPNRAEILANPYFSVNPNNLFILRGTRIWEVTSERVAKLWWEALVQFKEGDMGEAKRVLASQFIFLADRQSQILEAMVGKNPALEPSLVESNGRMDFDSLYVSPAQVTRRKQHLLRLDAWHERTVKSWAALAMEVPEVFSVMSKSEFADYLYE